MVQLQSLCLDPTKGFEILQEEVVAGQLRGKFDTVIAAALRHPDQCLHEDVE